MTEALHLIATESFDALITDLHMPNPGDGFTVVSAMRHSQPSALTLLVSGYPDVQTAMSAILLEADEIMVKPFEVGELMDLLHKICSLADLLSDWKRKEWPRYCSGACPESSKTGWHE